jgi:hypothetical protein
MIIFKLQFTNITYEYSVYFYVLLCIFSISRTNIIIFIIISQTFLYFSQIIYIDDFFYSYFLYFFGTMRAWFRMPRFVSRMLMSSNINSQLSHFSADFKVIKRTTLLFYPGKLAERAYECMQLRHVRNNGCAFHIYYDDYWN